MKAQEILKKKYEQRQRGRGGKFHRGRGRFNNGDDRFDNFVQDKEKYKWKNKDKGKIKWKGGNSYWGGYNSFRGRGSSNPRGGYHGKCYRCGGEGHRSFECKSYSESVV